MVRHYPAVTLTELQLAAKIASQIAAIETAPLNGGHWRLFRVFHLYLEARAIRDNMDRLHQYCRCIDGLIVSKQGEAKKQFKSRSELFIGPRHHDMMGETYDVRSDVEHLHENKHLEVFDRTARLELVKKLEMMEYIARSALLRIVLESSYGRTSQIRLRCKRFGRSMKSSGVRCGVPPLIRPMLLPSLTLAIFPTLS